MTGSNPSLYRLFRRSRYLSSLPDSDGEGTDVRSERERYATAAVAFCLKHSSSFRQRFWRTTCRMDGDPFEVPNLAVLLEPPNWADLRLVARSTHRTVWVIEFKLDAELADKQNPRNACFTKPGVGYGAIFHAHESQAGADLRYVVIGSRILRAGTGLVGSLGIHWHARSWQDLDEGTVPEDSLTADLFDSLGLLGVTAFRMKDTKVTRIEGPFGQAAQAWDVLVALAERYGQSRSQVVADQPIPGHFNMGMFLRVPKVPRGEGEQLAKLAKDLKSPLNSVVWLGYETGPEVGGFCKSAWFYCGSRQLAKNLRTRVKGIFSSADLKPDGANHCVVIRAESAERQYDYDWFIKTVKTAAPASP